MDVRAALAAFEEQVRRVPPSDGPDSVVEHDGDIVRVVAERGWSGVVWSGLDGSTADAAIARQLARFAGLDWEWKLYSYDQPPDLAARLRAAGLVPEPAETLMLAEVAELDTDPAPPAGVHLELATDQAGLDRLVALHQEVFGGHAPDLAGRLRADPDSLALVLAVDSATGTAVAAARTEYPAGTRFAGLWGGGTLPGWRGRGVFRALVAYRAALAAERGVRWLQVDARPTSQPILTRLGFANVATVTGWVPPGGI
jgi:GNAT superfamily N-acetyltransferase